MNNGMGLCGRAWVKRQDALLPLSGKPQGEADAEARHSGGPLPAQSPI